MASLTNYAKNLVLDYALGLPRYVGLFSTATTDAGGGTELSGSGYARELLGFEAASGGAGVSEANVTFTSTGGVWLEATHRALFDASTGGNMRLHGALDSPRTVADGGSATFAAGSVSVSAD